MFDHVKKAGAVICEAMFGCDARYLSAAERMHVRRNGRNSGSFTLCNFPGRYLCAAEWFLRSRNALSASRFRRDPVWRRCNPAGSRPGECRPRLYDGRLRVPGTAGGAGFFQPVFRPDTGPGQRERNCPSNRHAYPDRRGGLLPHRIFLYPKLQRNGS